jgi:hypothetical protein
MLHRRLAAITQTVEGDALRIGEGQRRQPIRCDFVLRNDE